MSVRINSLNKIKKRLGIEPNGKVQAYMVEVCKDYMEKYVPLDENNLRRNVYMDNNSITYQSPYAHYQYTGKLYVDPITRKGAFYKEGYGFWSRKNVEKVKTNTNLTYTTPGTGPYWDKRMISNDIKEVCKKIEKRIKNG